ncbi:unnamed protein product [Blepharisma stoltei]|uniref:Uncharacterized protein n=1 Tax=Blepharisma stoltei TaxID=1481888 RepID=A0AAU9K599_9CILI|nr:unnamed protein product [Blepharisma stoltei]
MESKTICNYLDSLYQWGMPNQTSVIKTQQSVIDDICPLKSPVKDEGKNFDFFVPFIKERDGLGRLITYKDENFKEKRAQSSYTPSRKAVILPPKRKLLMKKLRDEEIAKNSPTVGSYCTPINWIKHSYSTKSLFFPKRHPSRGRINQNPNFSQNTSTEVQKKLLENSMRSTKQSAESTIDRKANKIKIDRKKGIWESLKLQGSAEEFRENLKLTKEKSEILQHQDNIKRLLKNMKKKEKVADISVV